MNSTENATILNVVFLFIQNAFYKIVRILATDLQLITSYFLFSVGHISSVIVATNSDSISASQQRFSCT